MSEGTSGPDESAGFGDSGRHAGRQGAADGVSPKTPNRADGTTDVVVVGGGVAGLVAALECAKIGLAVTVLERRDVLGGCVGRIELAGLTLDSGAESFATRGGAVAELLLGLGLGDAVEQPNPAGAWLVWPAARGGRGGALGIDAAPLPRTGMLGIPANPLGDDVRRIIGWNGASRAYLDRLKPILSIGRAHSLGKLVRDRMGALVLDRLVAPISSGVYSTNPDDLDLDVVAPGLNEAMTRTGSLSGGVGQLLEERKAGGAVQGLDGGMHRLVDALLVQLERFGARVVTDAPVASLVRAENDGGDAGWRATAMHDDEELVVDATFAIIAAPAEAARTLLAEAVDGWADEFTGGPSAASIEIVTVVLDAPALDEAPRGTGVLVATGTPGVAAKALTHSTAKWPWLSRRTDGRHVVRLSYGRAGEPNPLDGLSEAEVRETALADASALLGVDLPADALLALGRSSWRDALSQATIGQRDRVRALEAVLAAEDGLEVTGSWVAGTGLASVVPHAIEAAARIRHLVVNPGSDA